MWDPFSQYNHYYLSLSVFGCAYCRALHLIKWARAPPGASTVFPHCFNGIRPPLKQASHSFQIITSFKDTKFLKRYGGVDVPLPQFNFTSVYLHSKVYLLGSQCFLHNVNAQMASVS